MKLLKKTLAAVVTVGALASAGSANAYLQNWYLDADGAGGGNAAIQVAEYVDMVGQAYVQNTFSSPTQFSFNEVGQYTSATADGFTPLGSLLTSTFTGSGVGDTTSGITFTSGALNVYSGATVIGTFNLLSGGAALNNAIVPNGFVSLMFEATYLADGYFFKNAALTDDLANELANNALIFGFTSTNASLATNWTAAMDTALTNLWNANYTPTITHIASNGTTDLVLGNNGQYRMQVPEPASLALVGLGLLGVGTLRRRSIK